MDKWRYSDISNVISGLLRNSRIISDTFDFPKYILALQDEQLLSKDATQTSQIYEFEKSGIYKQSSLSKSLTKKTSQPDKVLFLK